VASTFILFCPAMLIGIPDNFVIILPAIYPKFNLLAMFLAGLPPVIVQHKSLPLTTPFVVNISELAAFISWIF
jgi:hypothetical protein